MGLNKTLSYILLAGSLILTPFVKADRYIYDDFSSGTLDTSRWEERGSLDEHYVNSEEGSYHTAQLAEADKEATLGLLRDFKAGESLEYNVNYRECSGNILGRIIINKQAGDTGLQTPQCEGQGFATGGAVGFWNGLSCVGQSINGLYHVKIDFFDEHVDATFTDPNGNIITYSPIFSQTIAPYTVEMQTRTGHNGIAHIDYDNFILTTNKNSQFIRGDANMDGILDVSDAVKGLLHLFRDDSLNCQDAVDVNDDGKLDISDPIFLLNYLFKGGQQIPPPKELGTDDTLDKLTCG